MTDLGQKEHHQEHEMAKELGFKVLSQNELCQTLEEVEAFHKKWLKEREKLPFQIDGIVVITDVVACSPGNLEWWAKRLEE